MKKPSKIFTWLSAVLLAVLFAACGEDKTAGGTVIDPNTIAEDSVKVQTICEKGPGLCGSVYTDTTKAPEKNIEPSAEPSSDPTILPPCDSCGSPSVHPSSDPVYDITVQPYITGTTWNIDSLSGFQWEMQALLDEKNNVSTISMALDSQEKAVTVCGTSALDIAQVMNLDDDTLKLYLGESNLEINILDCQADSSTFAQNCAKQQGVFASENGDNGTSFPGCATGHLFASCFIPKEQVGDPIKRKELFTKESIEFCKNILGTN